MKIDLFSTPITVNKLTEQVLISTRRALEEYLKDINYTTFDSTTKTTYQLDNIFSRPEYNKLKKSVLIYVNDYITSNKIDIDISNCELDGWVNISNKFDYQEYHNHSNPKNILSGNIFINSDEKQKYGRLVFYNPFSNLIRYSRLDCNNSSFTEKYFIKPEIGKVVIFPSWLNHSVEHNDSEVTRITISFNIKL